MVDDRVPNPRSTILIRAEICPSSRGLAEAIPAIGALVDADAILNQNAFAEIRYPWASAQPRFSLQAAIEAAIAGTLTPKQALEQAQQETDDWLAQQVPTPIP